MRTVKLELLPKGNDSSERTEKWKRVKKLAELTAKSANIIVNNLYYSDIYRKKLQALHNHEDKVKLRNSLNKEKSKLSNEKKEIETYLKENKDIDEEEKNKKKERIEEIKNELEGIKAQYKEVKDQISAIEKESFEKFKEQFEVQPKAFSERMLKEEIPEIPSCISNILTNNITGTYFKENYQVHNGDRSIRNYKKNIPMPIQKSAIKYYYKDEYNEEKDKTYTNVIVEWNVQRGEKLLFSIKFGKDKANNRHTMNQIINNEIEYSAPNIQVRQDREKKDKIFLLLPVQDGVKDESLDPELSVGVDLGMAIPAVCATSKGYAREYIGNIKDFLRVRNYLQNRKRRLQKDLKMAKGGKGRFKKTKALRRVDGKERRFVNQYNHMISKHVVDFAIKQKAGTIKIEFLKGFGQERNTKSDFVLRNWSYYELQQMIKYKAERYGIEVVYIDPYHTSQTCSECGHYEPGQRKKQSEFVCNNPECRNYGKKVNADYNAAKEIAQSTNILAEDATERDCMYYKFNKAKKKVKVKKSA